MITAKLAKIIIFAVKEANDACLWLKAAGFPQYVQMYKGETLKCASLQLDTSELISWM